MVVAGSPGARPAGGLAGGSAWSGLIKAFIANAGACQVPWQQVVGTEAYTADGPLSGNAGLGAQQQFAVMAGHGSLGACLTLARTWQCTVCSAQ